MTREIILHPKYEHLRSFVESLPSIFESEGRLIRKMRNEIKVFEVEGLRINVKRFGIPAFIHNRIVYKYFRPTKAKRAYDNALKLLGCCIPTPEPIAYIVDSSSLFLGYSYFVSIHSSYRYSYDDILKRDKLTDDDKDTLREVALLAAKMHENGIDHRDFSQTNILFDTIDGEKSLCVIDINRMNFGEISPIEGCKLFDKLRGTDEMYGIIANTYAQARGIDSKEAFRIMTNAKDSFERRRRFKIKNIAKRIFRKSQKK